MMLVLSPNIDMVSGDFLYGLMDTMFVPVNKMSDF